MAAVPKRLTRTTRSQSSADTLDNGPQTSVPAAVTTASGGPTSSTSRWRAAVAAPVSDRSATTWTTSGSSGGVRSMTAGTPPALATAVTMAAPRPLEPPVTTTVPGGVDGRTGAVTAGLLFGWTAGRRWSTVRGGGAG